MGPGHLIPGPAAGHHYPQPLRSEVRVRERDGVTPLIRAMMTYCHKFRLVTAPSPSQTSTGGLSALPSREPRRG